MKGCRGHWRAFGILGSYLSSNCFPLLLTDIAMIFQMRYGLVYSFKCSSMLLRCYPLVAGLGERRAYEMPLFLCNMLYLGT